MVPLLYFAVADTVPRYPDQDLDIDRLFNARASMHRNAPR